MIGERIKQIRETAEDKKLSMAAFGERLGASAAAVNQWEHGKNAVPTTMVNLICSEFGINKDWLLTGNGEMYEPITREAELAEIAAKLFNDQDPMRQKLFELISGMSEKELQATMILRDYIVNNLDK